MNIPDDRAVPPGAEWRPRVCLDAHEHPPFGLRNLGVTAVLAASVSFQTGWRGSPWWIPLIYFAALLPLVFLFTRFLPRIQRAIIGFGIGPLPGKADARDFRVRRAIAGGGVCPNCQTPILDQPPRHDGCVECPACRSAWRVDLWTTDSVYVPPPVPDIPAGAVFRRSLRSLRPSDFVEDRHRTVRDARFREVTLLTNRTRDEREEMIETRLGLSMRERRPVMLGVAVLVLAPTLAMGYQAYLDDGPLWAVFVASVTGLGVLALFGSVAYFYFQVRDNRRVIKNLTIGGLCASCESPLRGTPSAIDGRLLCDTCGCAWDPVPSTPAGRDGFNAATR